MAGGAGTRFWPLSRSHQPKQLLPIVSRKTMIEETVNRLSPFIPPQRILVITGKQLKPKIEKILRSVPKGNIIAEPCPRNTAPCLALAALHIEKKDPRAVFIALPADHAIRDVKLFRMHLDVASRLASKERHVVFGVPPTLPHTGFGYIACRSRAGAEKGIEIYRGLRFVEKPTIRKAEAFLRSGKYLWNSGIFVWKLSFFLDSLAKALPAMGKQFPALRAALGTSKEQGTVEKIFPRFPDISVDYGLMESAKELFVIKARFDWSDVGSWRELENWHPKDAAGNAVSGNTIAVESFGNIVRAETKLVALLGVSNLLIVESRDALLVASKDRAQEVKRIVEELRRRKLIHFL